MKRAGVLAILLIISIAFAGSAAADDIFVPKWRDGHNTVYAEWDSWIPTESYAPDYYVSNPPLQDAPIAYAYGAGYLSSFAGRDHVMEMWTDDGLEFEIPNYDNDNPLKRVRLQITYYDAYAEPYVPFGFNVWTYLHHGTLFYPADETTFVGSYAHEDDWTTAAYEFEIIPNPGWEVIGLKFYDYVGGFEGFGSPNGPVPGVFIDQVVIDTQCAVPVPAAIWLFGTGVVCLMSFRRKLMK
jgi:hypothetical protein